MAKEKLYSWGLVLLLGPMIQQLRTNPPTAGFTTGSRVVIYGIK